MKKTSAIATVHRAKSMLREYALAMANKGSDVTAAADLQLQRLNELHQFLLSLDEKLFNEQPAAPTGVEFRNQLKMF